MEIHHPIALGKDKTEGAGRYKDPAGAQEDDSQHSQEFTGQEIVSSQQEKAARTKRGITETPWHPTSTGSIFI